MLLGVALLYQARSTTQHLTHTYTQHIHHILLITHIVLDVYYFFFCLFFFVMGDNKLVVV